MSEWKRTLDVLPPENLVVDTKIDDGKFIRNEQRLYRYRNLWFIPDWLSERERIQRCCGIFGTVYGVVK